MARVAALLGKSDDARQFNQLSEKIRAAFNAKFYNAKQKSYATGSQCANAIPLVMGLCEPANRADVVESIVRDVRLHGNAFTAGDVGYRYLLRALAEGGRSDVIFDMNNQSDKPGYGYQLKAGATSLTEAWDANRAFSQDHFMLGQIMEWFYADLAGISSDPAGPGFKKIVLRPQPVGDITWVRAAYNSVHGRIVSSWQRTDGKFMWTIKIPANTTATIYMPCSHLGQITESGSPVTRTKSVRYLRHENDREVFEIGSGEYTFISKQSALSWRNASYPRKTQ